MTETKTAKDVAGMALYLEFRKPDYTYQVIITQPVIDVAGKRHRSRIMRRRMNAFQSRKNWNFDNAPTSAPMVEPTGTFTQVSMEDAKTFAGLTVSGVMTLLNQLFHQEYVLHQKPIMVEMSYEDFTALCEKKTPNGLIRRIQRTRIAQGFGEEIVSTTAPTPAV